MIPLVMRLVVSGTDSKNRNKGMVNLWLPLFILWILILPLIVIVLTLWIVLCMFAGTSPTAMRLEKIIRAGALVVWNISGLRVDVRSSDSRFVLHF